MIRLFVFVAALIAAGSPVLALSCMGPDAVRLYEAARDAEEVFVIVKGRIDLTGPLRDPVPGSETPALTKARITGTALTSHGFGTVFAREITIEAHCLASWCGSAERLTGEVFAALQVKGEDLTLRVGPCGGDVVQWDKPGERRLLTCHRGGACVGHRF